MRRLFQCLLLILSVSVFATEKVVENDINPKGKALTIEFKEDLRFGTDEEDDNYLWADPSTAIEVNSMGHIFIADTREKRVLEFNPTGEFVRVIASPGQGPGELQGLADISILEDDSIVVLNAGIGVMSKFLFFDKNGKYVRDVAPLGFSTFISTSEFSPDGSLFGGIFVGFDMESGVMQFKAGTLNLKFETIQLLSEHPQSFNPADFQSQAGIVKFFSSILTNAYKGTGMVMFDKAGHGYSAVSNSYEITKWDPSFQKKLMIIKKKYKPIPNTDERKRAIANRTIDGMRQNAPAMVNDSMVDQLIEKTELPLVTNPVNGIITIGNEHILVIHDANEATGVQKADIFDKDGVFLGNVTMDHWAFLNPDSKPSMVFKNGFAYCLETDKNDENRLVRYKYSFKQI